MPNPARHSCVEPDVSHRGVTARALQSVACAITKGRPDDGGDDVPTASSRSRRGHRQGAGPARGRPQEARRGAEHDAHDGRVAAGIGDTDTFDQASKKAGSFGLFIRSLVGLDRGAAKAAFAEFLDDKRYTKNQIQFVNLIIDELTVRGVVEAARVYESPYDAIAPQGPEQIFTDADLDRLFAVIDRLASSTDESSET